MSEQGSGVPEAKYVEDIAQFVKGRRVEEVITELNINLQKYKMLESSLMQTRARLKGKLPEMQKALDIVETLIEQQDSGNEITLDYALADQVYAKAKVKEAKTVNLWLGAHVMVEYSLDEAKQVLTDSRGRIEENLDINRKNLEFIKDNITTTEVTLARVFNHDVAERRKAKEQGKQ